VKSQTDMIVSIVAILLALIVAGVCFGTARKPVRPPEPEKVIVQAPAYPAGSVTFANALPGGGSSQGAGGGGARMGGGSSSPKFAGRPSDSDALGASAVSGGTPRAAGVQSGGAAANQAQ